MYYLLTRSCRDLRQISTLGNQLFPNKGSRFMAAYMDAVDNPLKGEDPRSPAHLYVSCHPVKTERNFQLLSGIFPPGGSMVLYRL